MYVIKYKANKGIVVCCHKYPDTCVDGASLRGCQLTLQEDAAPDCNYKKKHYCNSYNKKRFV